MQNALVKATQLRLIAKSHEHDKTALGNGPLSVTGITQHAIYVERSAPWKPFGLGNTIGVLDRNIAMCNCLTGLNCVMLSQ
jgi:hypothetical protein